MSPRFRRMLPAALLLLTLAPARPRAADKRLNWDKRWGPLVPHKKFPKDCALCHVPKRWDVLRGDFQFDHLKQTGYPLAGAHADAACLRCHNDRGPVSAYLSRGCSGCHVDPHKGAAGLNCARCHDQDRWSKTGRAGEKIAEHARTRFALSGMHAAAQCRQCHERADAGEFTGAPLECAACHRRDYQSAPKHAALSYPETCRDCHGTTSFAGAAFNHAALPGNPACVLCHQRQFAGAPNHVALNFSQDCRACHDTIAWQNARFDHSPLGPSPACETCHMAEYNGATSPVNHIAQGIPAAGCNSCHTTFNSWTGFRHVPSSCFNSSTARSHQRATCAQCHPGAVYQSASCTACHADRGNSCSD